ncbi:MAG TPA: DUF4395 domain-containing protein [Jiangellaceae bacterium]|nr:DUF4395 domain-containing protein [Jiangellaceae bacterium]
MIDPRGPRFAAAITTAVLAAALVTGNAWLLAVQVAVFAVAAFGGLRASPYGLLYARFVRPRLAPPGELEDERPPRFAQAVGLVFGVAGLIGLVAGWTVVFHIAVAAALGAAFLNAAFGFCLGCEIYLLVRRTTSRTTSSASEVTTS